MGFARLALAAFTVALTGCASLSSDPFAVPPIADHLQRADAIGDCARLLHAVDRQTISAAARDAQDTVVAGFPYLRIDRNGVALRPPVDDPVRWQAWRTRLALADRDARRHERRNAGTPGRAAALDDCRQTLLAADDVTSARVALAAAAQVPDDYSTTLRALGLYPLTRLAFAAGISGWQRETVKTFVLPLERLPRRGTLRQYDPAAEVGPALARLLDESGGPGEPRDPLGLPRPAALAGLLLRHAPRIEVEEAGAFDRIGPLALAGGEGQAHVDLLSEPAVYVRVGHARFGGVWRLQLVYTFWFPQRPPSGALDLLAGELDALIWRVTLDDEGRALLYDSIHACGCYHLFFATPHVQPRSERPPGQGRLDEGLFMPQATLPLAPADERIVLRVESGSHYLQRVMLRSDSAVAGAVPDRRYQLRDEDELRSLPVAGQAGVTRSAYDASGMIPGTERLERWLFWPMGIASAGQMRQWGRHATAFVGRRHFDDPLLLDRYFTLSTGESQ